MVKLSETAMSGLILLFATPLLAQTATMHNAMRQSIDHVSEAPVGFRSGNFVAAPIPLSNPTLGTGLALGGGYLFKLDDQSASSFIGLGGFKTSNGSKGAAVGGSLNFGDGDWQVSALYGQALVNYDFYGVGREQDKYSVPFEQTGTLASLSAGYQLFNDFYTGVNLRYLDTEVDIRLSELDISIGDIAIDLPDISDSFRLGMVGPYLEYDSRNDRFYPTEGQLATMKMNYGFSPDDEALSYQTYIADYASYLSVLSKDVIATRLTVCGVGGEVPFFDLCALGGTDNFRGYPVGQYLDRALMSVQSEYRGNFSERFGYVAFVGAAAVGDSFDDLGRNFPAAGGLGLRIKLSKAFNLDFSIDGAINVEGETSTYVYVGQRF